jgi:hypothetical protein
VGGRGRCPRKTPRGRSGRRPRRSRGVGRPARDYHETSGLGGITIVLFATDVLGSKVTQENFQKVKWGMTEAEVRSILGSPSEVITVGPLRTLSWKRGGSIVIVSFTDGRATNIAGTFMN